MFVNPVYLLALFFIIPIYYLIPSYLRLFFLLLLSLAFIGYYNIASLIVVIGLSGINYLLALRISGKADSITLKFGLFINGFAILLFNYFVGSPQKFGFKITAISYSAQAFIMVLGLSFFSIQHMAYLYDISKQRILPEKNFFKHLLSITFFPKIVCGPIYPLQDFFPKINSATYHTENLISGFNRLLLGIAKKMILADRLAPSVHSVFDYDVLYPGITTIIGAAFFTLQLYFDFSAYSDMAIGIAQMLGFKLNENFNSPFRSLSVTEFWRRWHISLIRFFTNYIYYPLVFKWRKYKKLAPYIGILATFLISGLWHGIGFTFILWAICHILYLFFELLSKSWRMKLPLIFNSYTGMVCTFLAVSFSNVFFRAHSFNKALLMVKRFWTHFFPENWDTAFFAPLAVGGQQAEYFNLIITIILSLAYLWVEPKIEKISRSNKINLTYIFVILVLLALFGMFNAGEQFIYMQF